jgi:hypothetical protein
MNIADFTCQHAVQTYDELASALRRRYAQGDKGVNQFWLAHDEEEYPQLGIQVNGQLATLHYFPTAGHPGFRSSGPAHGLDPDGWTLFWISEIDSPADNPNRFVVGLEVAEKAARAFMEKRDLPANLEWFEL